MRKGTRVKGRGLRECIQRIPGIHPLLPSFLSFFLSSFSSPLLLLSPSLCPFVILLSLLGVGIWGASLDFQFFLRVTGCARDL